MFLLLLPSDTLITQSSFHPAGALNSYFTPCSLVVFLISSLS
ncbi:hypothetical protein MmTuc01_2428 [Methanosarcina mazei Tuc01]|uniref:Uncharacterized protein n=1 Tax=Methanosarcina mazei Tuc01 TaxID=1236903 RepID=M1QBW3_METMZ|nr:hypothetical protein MmTuc01_2428 [Methanosarcina mazei Tuc01]